MRRGVTKRSVTLPPLDPELVSDLGSLSLQPPRPRPGGAFGLSSFSVGSDRFKPPPSFQDETPPPRHKVLDAAPDQQLATVLDSGDSRKMMKYLRHHPELPGVTADLIHAIVANRPNDIAAFAADAFFSGPRAEDLRIRYQLQQAHKGPP